MSEFYKKLIDYVFGHRSSMYYDFSDIQIRWLIGDIINTGGVRRRRLYDFTRNYINSIWDNLSGISKEVIDLTPDEEPFVCNFAGVFDVIQIEEICLDIYNM